MNNEENNRYEEEVEEEKKRSYGSYMSEELRERGMEESDFL